MRTLKKQQLSDICYGAGFLGSSGGGSLKTALRLVENLPDDVTVNVNTVEEVEDDKRTAFVAFMGAPEKMLKIQNSQSAIAPVDLNPHSLILFFLVMSVNASQKLFYSVYSQ
ncbi:MAG: DUF917 family protein [Cyanobacteriota bacterium]